MTLVRKASFVAALMGVLLWSATARAQSMNTGAIAGTVKDATGGVLPGVTVEAASPALIDKVRSVVTDTRGEYKIVELRPGTYTVTFTLPGFTTVRREGLELTTGFTATVNADLKVGELQETVIVTGASPVVDVENVRTQVVLSRAVQDALPTSKSTNAFASLTLGIKYQSGPTFDVGGDKGEGNARFGVHGTVADDSRLMLDGMPVIAFNRGSAGNRHWQTNNLTVEEVTLTNRSVGAESEVGGAFINNVPKEGGNTFHLTVVGDGASSGMQSKRLTDELRARGVTAAPAVKVVYDYGIGAGGPVRQDKLWYYAAARKWGAQSYAPGSYFQNKTDPAARGGLLWVPDLSRPAYLDSRQYDYSGRLTWQATSKHKIAGYFSRQNTCYCYITLSATRAPEHTGLLYFPVRFPQARWTYPATNRLLFEAGLSGQYAPDYVPRPDYVKATDIPVTELSTGLQYNALGGGIGPSFITYGKFNNHFLYEQFSMSYVTGSHALKIGVQDLQSWMDYNYEAPPVYYQFRFGVPVAIQEWAMPQHFKSQLKANLGIYAQDQWTLRNLTLNLGVRFDYNNSFNPANEIAAGPFVPARSFPRTEAVNWKDVSPRLGAAYDLFGNGKTAIKVAINRYVSGDNLATAPNTNLAYTIATNATRSWTDANRDYVPDCDLANPFENGECGTLNNLNLGKTVPATTYADGVLEGWFNRQHNWQVDASIQHELRPNVSVMVAYYRTRYGNLTVTHNAAVTPADFDPYCITAPVDRRLPGGGGSQICGLYDVNPSKFGQVRNIETKASDFDGTYNSVTNGLEVYFRAQFGQGGVLQGGVSSDQTIYNACLTGLGANPMAPEPSTAALPGSARRLPASQCKLTEPFSKQLQVKLLGVYPLPWWGLQTSAVFQNVGGPANLATYNVPRALIAPSLGRNLAGNVATAAIGLVEPFTMYEKRFTQIDLRVTKKVEVGRIRLLGRVDLYNVLNSRAILQTNSTYGPRWLEPLVILGGRMVKFGGELNF